MREILFRGKRIDNGEWIKGSYIVAENCDSEDLIYLIAPLTKMYTDVVGVIPETVGQYTGLIDADGVKIFEGDIVRLYGENGDENVVLFKWNGLRAMFICRTLEDKPANLFVNKSDFFRVLGNIHDNPELLRGDN